MTFTHCHVKLCYYLFTPSLVGEDHYVFWFSVWPSGRCPLAPQGQYGIEYLYLLLAAPPYMAAANFVVITNGGGARSLEQPISTNSVPRTIFPRVAIGCRLSLKIDRNLEGSLSVATWDDTAWIGGTASGTSYISVVSIYFTWRNISVLGGQVAIKRGTNIHRASEHCWKGSQVRG